MYTVGDLVQDRYSSFSGVVVSVSDSDLLGVVSSLPGEHTRKRYLQSAAVIPSTTPYLYSVVGTPHGSGVYMWSHSNYASILLDSGDKVMVEFTEMVVNMYDNQYVDNRYLDIFAPHM